MRSTEETGKEETMTTPKRILILHASCGAGHARAAQAVEQALAALRPELGAAAPEVRVVDALDCTSPRFRKLYVGVYEKSVKDAPWAYGAGYTLASAAARLSPFRTLRRTFNRFAARRLGRLVEEMRPDVVLCTHFLPLDFLGRWKARGKLRGTTLACVVTDYVAHGFWAEPRADRYYVPSPEVARELARRGVRPGRVLVTGIPVDAAFAEAAADPRAAEPPATPRGDLEDRRRALDLRSGADRRTVLVLGGGLGMGPVAAVVRSIAAEAAPGLDLEVTAVCGKNEALRLELEAIAATLPVPVRVLGFTREVPALMAAADIVVTKPGGLTTTEALAIGRPLVLYTAMPGQEEGNALYLARAGAAVCAEPPGGDPEAPEVGPVVRALLADAPRLERLAAAARALSRPHAARAIARDVAAVAEPRLAPAA